VKYGTHINKRKMDENKQKFKQIMTRNNYDEFYTKEFLRYYYDEDKSIEQNIILYFEEYGIDHKNED
jgi:hypothetical protein